MPQSPFRSFWIGGFESSSHVNLRGRRLDLVAATQHDLQAEHDAALLRSQGMHAARDAVRWHLLERGGRIDLAPLVPRVAAAERAGVQVIWDLCHYGWPDDLDVFSSEFVERFARFCSAVARCVADLTDGPPLFTPVNEVSFLAWAAGQVGYIHPFGVGRGTELKRQLVRAFVAGSEAIADAAPGARILTAEPLIHVVPPYGEPDLVAAARRERDSQFEAWDMLAGRAAPELGGNPRLLDVLGVNFYHDNQWQHPDGEKLGWDQVPLDERWVPLHLLLEEVWLRYGRPLYIAETSHFGRGRASWLRHVTDEVLTALGRGVPVLGVCLYPVLDRPDWDDPYHWHRSGLWDLEPAGGGRLARVLHRPYAAELRRSQLRVAEAAGPVPGPAQPAPGQGAAGEPLGATLGSAGPARRADRPRAG